MRSYFIGRIRSVLVISAIAWMSVAFSPTPAHAADPSFTFKGGGWGHGIGMSQYGAVGYAQKGWKYSSILAHYYQGTKLVTKPTVKMRVNIEDNGASRTQWKIRAGSNTELVVVQESDSTVRQALNATSSYWITAANGDTQVRADSSGVPGKVLKTFSGGCYASSGGLVQMLSSSGPFNHTGVRWRGTIHFKPLSTASSRTLAINYVDIEKYLYGVVPRESPSSWHREALKAQAVAARSYAYQNGAEGRAIYCTTKSQVYNGHSRPGHSHEAVSTNAAVDATKGQLVWYGTRTKPVKTYFSSCSGGHTANIEDVWTNAKPEPYYRGVTDADGASPYYTWTSSYSAKTVAEKIRALDLARGGGLEYSVAAPAVVTGIATERATSGHTHHVRVTWSNGSTFRLTGATLQSAMRLRSSKFAATRSYPTVSKRRYQESDSRLAWHGFWRRLPESKLSGGVMAYSKTGGSTLTASFSGSGFDWIGKEGPTHGKAEVHVDGKLVKVVDLYATAAGYGRTIYSTRSLGPGTHTLVIKALGTKRSASTGVAVPIDALDIVNGTLSQATPSLNRYEENHERLARVGPWYSVPSTAFSGGRVRRANSGSAVYYCTFYGNEVRWIGSRSSSYGKARVSVDGGAPQEVTLSAPSWNHQQVLYSRTGLAQDRAHTLRIQAVGPDSGGSGFVVFDALEVRGGWLLPAAPANTTVDQSHASATWSSGWTTASGSGYVGGSHKTASTRPAAVKFKFDGNSVVWIGRKAPSYGHAAVYLDGVYKGKVDLYRSAAANRQAVWDSGRIGSGVHELEIRALGSRSSKSTGNTVSVDAFRVAGQPR